MSPEEKLLKAQYRRLYSKLKQISSELSTTNNVIIDINNMANNTLKINKKVVEDELFKSIKSTNQRLITNINSTISRVESRM